MALCGNVRADSLVTSVSTPRVAILSNFSGADLVVFGAIDRESQLVSQGRYDVVVTVRGPNVNLDVRRKNRRAGLWINTEEHRFGAAPSFMAILATRPLSEIASPETLQTYRLSLAATIGPETSESVAPDDGTFREAVVRLQRQAGLYVEQSNSVIFISPTFFRVTLPLPPNVPLGIYQVETRLFVGGQVIASQKASLEVIKKGFDETIATWARIWPFFYGLGTIAMAIFLGWLATIIFRRD